MSVDPAEGLLDRPQSWNRYSYVLGNPVKYFDRYGLFPCPGLPDLECQESVEVIGEALDYDPLTGVQGLNDLVAGRGLLSMVNESTNRGVQSVRGIYERRFDQQVAAGNYGLAFIDFVGLELFIPQDSGDVALELGLAMIPGGKAGRLGKRAIDLIPGALRRSKSFRSELAEHTYAEIIDLSKGKGPLAQAARQMKKLIEQSERLQAKAKARGR